MARAPLALRRAARRGVAACRRPTPLQAPVLPGTSSFVGLPRSAPGMRLVTGARSCPTRPDAREKATSTLGGDSKCSVMRAKPPRAHSSVPGQYLRAAVVVGPSSRHRRAPPGVVHREAHRRGERFRHRGGRPHRQRREALAMTVAEQPAAVRRRHTGHDDPGRAAGRGAAVIADYFPRCPGGTRRRCRRNARCRSPQRLHPADPAMRRRRDPRAASTAVAPRPPHRRAGTNAGTGTTGSSDAQSAASSRSRIAVKITGSVQEARPASKR